LNTLAKNSDPLKVALVNNELGLNFLKLSNYKQAGFYILEACKITESNQEHILLAKYQKNLASVYLYERKTKEALELLHGLISNKNSNSSDSAAFLFNIGTAHLIAKDTERAIDAYKECIVIRYRLGDLKGVARIHNNLSKIYLNQGKYKDASYHLHECQKVASMTGDQQLLYGNSYNLLDYYIIVGQKDSAKKYLKLYTNLRDSIKSIQLQGQLLELDKKYKTLEKDNQIATLQKEDALNQSRLKSKNILIAITSSFLLILLVVGLVINRQRKELAQSRKRLLRQKEDITGMNEQLRVSNLAKDRILSVIGHDLRGPVGGLKELIELYMELPEYEPNDIKNLLTTAREASTSTYHLLENLLSWANSQRGDIEFNPVATPLAPLIKQSVQLLDSSVNVRHVRFEFDIPQALVIQADMNMLRTIIRNLVSNALKYSPENSTIKVIVVDEGRQVKICICDQGKGMSAEETQNVFKKKETYFIGSELTAKGTGLGLILCKEFVERHGGTIWIHSEEGVGTQVWFSIPQKGVATASVGELQRTGVQ
jgi:signal transduction histidine kinase